MTYLELINKIRDVASKHKQVASIGNGRQSDLDPADRRKYPTVWIIPINGRHTINNGDYVQRWDIGLLCGDLIHDNQFTEININLTHEKCYNILKEILIKLVIDEELLLDGDVAFENFIDDFDAGLTGWVARLTIIEAINPLTCNLPFNV